MFLEQWLIANDLLEINLLFIASPWISFQHQPFQHFHAIQLLHDWKKSQKNTSGYKLNLWQLDFSYRLITNYVIKLMNCLRCTPILCKNYICLTSTQIKTNRNYLIRWTDGATMTVEHHIYQTGCIPKIWMPKISIQLLTANKSSRYFQVKVLYFIVLFVCKQIDNEK